MLTQNDPFREFDALFDRMSGRGSGAMALDAFRRGNDVWVHLDLPGVKPEDLDITVERNVLSISARREWQRQDGDRVYFAERRLGTFRRQIQLGDGLELEHLEADLHDGVLTIRVPVAEKAKPRRVQLGSLQASPTAIEATAN